MKQCPYCTGELPDEALKCKHCGEWLEAPPSAPAADKPQTVKLQVEQTAFQKKVFIVILVFVFLVLFGIAGVFFGVILPQITSMQQQHEQFRKNFNKKANQWP